MNIADIKMLDTINGDGLRVSVFVSGCTLHCKGCFNKIAWDFNYGREFDFIEDEKKIFERINNPKFNYSGLSILGGEPTDNYIDVVKLIYDYKKACPNKDLWIWSGRELEDIKAYFPIFLQADYLVLGPFIESQKNLNLRYRGSENQHIYRSGNKEIELVD